MVRRILKHIGWFWLRVALLFLCGWLAFIVAQAQTDVKEDFATVKKINWQDGKIIGEEIYNFNTKLAISETDSTLLVGSERLRIIEIIPTDSVVTYIAENKPDKEYVYDYDAKLTQKNIKWRSHGLETWFVYELINKSKNEFEFGDG